MGAALSPPSQATLRPRGYQICVRCIMDTSDPDITFTPEGVCKHCLRYETTSRPKLAVRHAPGALEGIVAKIKEAGKGKDYDAILALSGGLDSTYAAYAAHKLGIRCLAVHVDNGWNRELAVANIQQVVDKLGMDLHTIVLDWDSFRDLQVAFLKASTPDSDIPADHAIVAGLYQAAAQFGISYVLDGSNERTEGVYVPAWSQGHWDSRYVKSVHKRHGTIPLRNYPAISPLRFAWQGLVKKVRFVALLDYYGYDRQKAAEELAREIGWRSYSVKHGESGFTRFFQSYILPQKFGYDKRRAHLSTLVYAGQITREEALRRLAEPLFAPGEETQERDYFIKKLGLTLDEFEAIMRAPPRSFYDYPSYGRIINRMPWIMTIARRLRRVDNNAPTEAWGSDARHTKTEVSP